MATLQETVTVSGASPVVDTSSTTMGTNFTKELLTEIPNARDVWAAMAQAPGIQMTQYDVGGSRTGNQSGYRAYGFDTQNQTRMEGIDTTEARAANAGYFDFGSFEEFQVSGAGADASAYAGGAVLTISIKSGGDRFSGNWYSDYLSEDTVAETNVPDYLQTANTPNEDGYYTRTPLTRGNPVQEQYDINFNIGGPIWKQKAWFFYSYRLNDQYTYILGLGDQVQRSKLTNPYTFKGTFQLGRNNQLIGFFNKREKLQDKRDVSLTTPLSAAYYQSSRNYPMKAQWTSVLSSRMFLDVMAAQWYNFFPLRPVRDYGLYDGPWGPGRQDTASLQYLRRRRQQRLPGPEAVQAAVLRQRLLLQGRLEGLARLQVRLRLEAGSPGLLPRSAVRHLLPRPEQTPSTQVDIYNTNTQPVNDVTYNAVWANDTWKVSDRLTLNLGLRFEAYKDGWGDQEFAPNGLPQLANWPADYRPAERQRYFDFIAPQTVGAVTVADTKTLSPRVGFAYDLTGDNRTVLKAYFGQTRFNSADLLADQENPVGLAQLRYALRALHRDRHDPVRPQRQPAARQPVRSWAPSTPPRAVPAPCAWTATWCVRWPTSSR